MNERPFCQKIQYCPSSWGSLERQSSHIGLAVIKACSFVWVFDPTGAPRIGKIITFFVMFISFLKTPSNSSLFRGCIRVKMSLFSPRKIFSIMRRNSCFPMLPWTRMEEEESSPLHYVMPSFQVQPLWLALLPLQPVTNKILLILTLIAVITNTDHFVFNYAWLYDVIYFILFFLIYYWIVSSIRVEYLIF